MAGLMAGDINDEALRRFPRALPVSGLRAFDHDTSARYRCSVKVSHPTRYEHPVLRQVVTCHSNAGQSLRVTFNMA